jgi:hypothetical protein
VGDIAGIVTGLMPGPIGSWELSDGHVHHRELVRTGVRGGVARSQDTGERFAGGDQEAEHRVEPVAALEVRRRVFLAFGVDLHQRRVDVQHDQARCHTGRPRRCSGDGTRGAERVLAGRIVAADDGWVPHTSTVVSIASNVRQHVAADATSPNRLGWSRNTAMSATQRPPSANITAVWTSSRPRSWIGARSPDQGTAPEYALVRPTRSATSPTK